MAWIGQIRGGKIFTEEGWVPLEDTVGPGPPPSAEPRRDVIDKLKLWGAASDDPRMLAFMFPDLATVDASGEVSGNWTSQEMQIAVSELLEEQEASAAAKAAGTYHPPAWRPGEQAIEQSKVHALNLATYLDATVAELEADIDAKRLNVEQAQAEFDRRMDALAEGGKQMAEMWQWTSAPGTETLLTDVRAGLGMQPWESKPVEFDPLAMAWDIVEQTPEILQTSPDFDPLTEALEVMGQFV